MSEVSEKNFAKIVRAPSTSTSSQDRYVGSVDDRKHAKNIFLRLNYYMEKLGGETRGIERIPEDERHDDSFWDTASMWFGANTVIASYALGMLGITTFGLGLRDSMAVIICFTVLGALPVAILSTFGPPTGMRQMILTRYWAGSIGARICAFLNAITCIGWSSVNTVAAVNSLHVVNHGGLPQWGGIILIAIVSWIIALFGYKIVHTYERYAWIPNVVVFFVICICLGQDGLSDWGTLSSGPTEAAGVLSFGGTIYGFAAGWGPYASDYTCYKPSNTSRTKVFCLILFWASVGCIVPMLIGAFSAQRILTSQAYADAYNENSTGGLLWMILVENKLHGFGQVCIVVLSLSTIANNIPNLYTFSVSAQAVLPGFEKIPQYIWATIITGASIGVSIPAVTNFSEYLGDFMDMIAYWISFYYGIVLGEHLFFRRGYGNYNIEAYDSFVKMPFGISAIFAGCAGCAGAAVGMSQVWYTGPIGAMIGAGGDIGFELSFGFAFVALVLTRWLERWIYPDESYVWDTKNAWWRLGIFNFPSLPTPSWAKHIDVRFWWARRTNQPYPGEGGLVEGPYERGEREFDETDVDVDEALQLDYRGRFGRNRGVEEAI